MSQRVAIIGPGRVGQSLGRLLRLAGVRVEYLAARRKQSALRAARFIGAGRAIGLKDPRLTEVDVVLVTTTDTAISTVAKVLTSMRKDWAGKVVLHTCGSLPRGGGDLRRLRERGAAVGCLHPFETIPTREAGLRTLRRCTWLVEGDSAARRIATLWVRRLGGEVVHVRHGQKALYHLAAFLACPGLITLMDPSSRFLGRAGVAASVARRMLAQIASSTARNFRDLGARKALTGPAVRGDWVTIRRHLEALRRSSPDFVPVYLGLLGSMVRLAGKRVPGLRRFKLAGRRVTHGSFTRRGSGSE